ncbi:hypothetical protein L1987_09319 [Smallanthus sonchifolius]|uniref:Uncharacterized protein n=1 Tax=Smallanthus sonchifolius TaxID=185202 RepID=A0ACB9JNL9_9ASTR|nr:hypothetical protein L1987_09319 [Smallanthus sonchifolius]
MHDDCLILMISDEAIGISVTLMWTGLDFTMAYLPVEVIILCILTRLTPKDVVKCKSVCKQWRSLLSTQEFERAHCCRSSIPFGVKDVAVLAHLDSLLCVSCIRPMSWSFGTQQQPHTDIYPPLMATAACIYSRRLGSSRKLPFATNLEYVKRTFYCRGLYVATLCTSLFASAGLSVETLCLDLIPARSRYGTPRMFPERQRESRPCLYAAASGEASNTNGDLYNFEREGTPTTQRLLKERSRVLTVALSFFLLNLLHYVA